MKCNLYYSMQLSLTDSNLYSFFLAFCRVGGIFLFTPFLMYVNMKTKVAFAVLISYIISYAFDLKPFIQEDYLLFCLLEIVTGVTIGILMNILYSVLEIMGSIISHTVGLSNSNLFDYESGIQSVVISKFLNITFLAMFFVTNLHLLFIEGIFNSYHTIPLDNNSFYTEIVNNFVLFINEIFWLSVKLTAPIWVTSFFISFSAGILNRLIPYMQIYFVSIPFQIFIGFILLFLVIKHMMTGYTDYHRELLVNVFYN
ncbi:MAG: bacterial export s, 1 family protein [Candidatus Xenolissoclinum pacificiensis L6]|uniref:Bacterial export s, 1 family protein n=1 Tax=Candidatus Xenolissoclinum pacificiensis L6 TaxID=1401685 RepID=W2V239_9RICK|nr:MAG: bacterial export s, 1 family protein [Candidatus Xenolissoclinum pacificiensis L6]